VTHKAVLVFGDEMRVGLIACVRKRWTVVGYKLVVRLQRIYKWRYLALGVDVANLRLIWCWIETMKKESFSQVLAAWREAGVGAVSWDNAAGHKSKVHEASGIVRVYQPPYSPEVNPPERVFEELRRAIEGTNYPTIEAKMAAVEKELKDFNAHPERIESLTRWDWIARNLSALPQE